MKTTRYENGFTLIELVTVISLLAILVTVALPKFIDVSGDARMAKLESLEGTLRSATTLVHSVAVVRGKHTSASETISIDGVDIAIRYGYPIGSADSLGKFLVTSPYAFKTEGSVVTGSWIFWEGSSDSEHAWGTQCYVQYYQAKDANTPPIIKMVDARCK